ncbi:MULTISPECIES: ectoine/hydroxyectoine ABC transporter substrate-binding protein EhuB [Bradyrhizobium]|nr:MULTISPECIES: ectoine/hydroxyectoine ABC transporter substrate-binding protein EhuB [Bradyrhizobium]MCG2629328.1 ectoine/hydroxyectoine ABC transporter substrate-binding protein EhuB [Bradyrhizobium zhengyangense]MCG2644609.1 ectoine/hydroxyectoine ABC transporter substrate-binding protein EhuB [Bradyrhizobium zhengyangense]MCG2670842.1 ectoine/hydroxyectoine ABC transporter substrate-binding protein EhuB [Bradyrhizobium zhengyangense]MDN4984474.1 ectoine/hydroxyectoine ABC transporter subst
MLRTLHIFLALAFLTFSSSSFAGARLDDAKKSGLTLGFSNEPPFAFKQADGSLAGSDYDLAKLAFNRLGVERIEGTVVAFGSLIPGLQAKRFDFIATGLYILPARCLQVLFTEPNFTVQEGLLVRKGNPKQIHSLDDIVKHEDIKVGGNISGQPTQNAVKAGVKDSQITRFPDIPSNVASLKAGRIDGALLISVTARWNAKNDPTLEVAEPYTGLLIDGKPKQDYGAFAFRKEDSELRDAFNAEMLKIVHSSEYVEILKKYGMTQNEVPAADVKLDTLCKQ